jgi:nitrite reductase/ring-hydroxylating ferredoxin subunit
MSEGVRAPVAGGQLERITGDTLIARRDYLRILVTVSGGLVVGAAAVAVGLFPRRTGAGGALRIADDIPAGGHVSFAYPGADDRAIAMRLPDGRLFGYSSICTHLSCAVLPRPVEAALVCPCHDGRFDATTGDVLEGPPPRPLPQILLERRDDGIYAIGAVPR